MVFDNRNGSRVGNLTQPSSWKGEKTSEWAMNVGKSKYALVGFQISWAVSPRFHKQNFPGFQILLHRGSFPDTLMYPSNWVIYQEQLHANINQSGARLKKYQSLFFCILIDFSKCTNAIYFFFERSVHFREKQENCFKPRSQFRKLKTGLKFTMICSPYISKQPH